MATGSIMARLEQIVDQAQTRLDLETAQNPASRKAIGIVEAHLRKMGRVCYGGQAINAQLPKHLQFYDSETSLPDYDFFTPNGKEDIDALTSALKAAGFTEISKRIGIHEGTTKIYVNYTAIADITEMPAELYTILAKNSVVVNGIHYADPIFLQMMMYLELSRPRGEVARWSKVYERLRLFQKAHPIPKCYNLSITESREAREVRPRLAAYMVKEQRAFMGADIHTLYEGKNKTRSAKGRMTFLLKGSAPIVFMSPDAEADAAHLVEHLNIRSQTIPGLNNILPPMVALYTEKVLVGLIVQQEACHSVITLPLTKQRVLKVASLDTLLTFLLGLWYREDSLVMTREAILCWAREYIRLVERFRARPTENFPAFSIECVGYQTSFASLLRAKAARIEADRQRVSSGRRETRRKTKT